MDLGTILLVLAALIAIALIASYLAAGFLGGRRKTRVRELLHGVLSSSQTKEPVRRKKLSEEDIENLKRTSADLKKKEGFTQNFLRPDKRERSRLEGSKFFQAGLFSAEDRKFFKAAQSIAPVIGLILGGLVMLVVGASPMMIASGIILGTFIGISLPNTWLERQIRSRSEETMYYLPLAIEQISIGVSSSLDIWPCISNILEMARQRDVHNPVTELFAYVEKLITSGLSLQDALGEVSTASGIPQVKHTFRYLGQVAEHGGEISKQLQELADAVMTERQTYVEGVISSLPVKATGPLFAVFTGFFIIMLSGVFVKLMISFPMG